MTKSYLRARRVVRMASASLFILLAMIATADAQNIAAVRRAVVSASKGSSVFIIDSTGATRGRNILEITRIDDSGSLVGFYYVEGASRPTTTNVTGSISLVRATGAAVFGNGIKILFTASSAPIPLLGRGGIVNTTTFEGALRLGSTRSASFMAGTFTISGSGSAGPYPFCARLESIPG